MSERGSPRLTNCGSRYCPVSHKSLLTREGILAERAPRHRHQEWLRFLKGIDAEVPADLAVHLILDNYATHKHLQVLAWIAKHSRFHLHFTPTSSSWLNLVERFFRDLSEDVLLPGSFGSVKELNEAILTYLAERNLHPQRYAWKANGLSILEKIRRAREALAQQSLVSKDCSTTMHRRRSDCLVRPASRHNPLLQFPETATTVSSGRW